MSSSSSTIAVTKRKKRVPFHFRKSSYKKKKEKNDFFILFFPFKIEDIPLGNKSDPGGLVLNTFERVSVILVYSFCEVSLLLLFNW